MKNYENELNSAIEKITAAAYDKTCEVCPVRTGRLKRSLTLTKTPDGAVINTDVPYAAKVEFGGYRNPPRHYLGLGAEYARQSAAEIFRTEMFGERSRND